MPHDHAAPSTLTRYCDVAVIGGSAAGLAGALQLARQRRTVVVIDDGSPRNARAARMHGYLGREGSPPSELIATGRDEVRSYGGEVLTGRVLAVHPAEDGTFRVDLTGGHTLIARRVLAATGIVDELPPVDGLAEQWGRGVVHCPFCHGFEIRDRRVVQIVTHRMGLHPTPLLRHLTGRLTVVVHETAGVDDAALEALIAAGITVVRATARRIDTGPDGEITAVGLADGTSLVADAVFVGAGFRARAEALAPAGVTTMRHPSGLGDIVEADPTTGLTGVRGIYAAGNLTDPSLQVLPAAARGSWVGAMIAFSLAEEDLGNAARTCGEQTEWERRYGSEEHVWSRKPNGTLVDQVNALAPGRALDVGAGEGADALWLAEHGWQVVATDISGNALARIDAEAKHRGLDVACIRSDADDPTPFGPDTFDLVSLQYGSFRRTPDQHSLHNLLDAVAPGGTLLVVGHDLTPLEEPLDSSTQTRMYDPHAYVGVDELAALLTDDPAWQVSLHETRPRPQGANSTHHRHDVVLRAVRR